MHAQAFLALPSPGQWAGLTDRPAEQSGTTRGSDQSAQLVMIGRAEPHPTAGATIVWRVRTHPVRITGDLVPVGMPIRVALVASLDWRQVVLVARRRSVRHPGMTNEPTAQREYASHPELQGAQRRERHSVACADPEGNVIPGRHRQRMTVRMVRTRGPVRGRLPPQLLDHPLLNLVGDHCNTLRLRSIDIDSNAGATAVRTPQHCRCNLRIISPVVVADVRNGHA